MTGLSVRASATRYAICGMELVDASNFRYALDGNILWVSVFTIVVVDINFKGTG